jgi:hypothetical protein
VFVNELCACLDHTFDQKLRTCKLKIRISETFQVRSDDKCSKYWTYNLSSLIKLVASSLILDATLLLTVDIVGTLACMMN